ncbi:MAG: NAD(P)/FAD-dependent oxidoreductase [Planctomycetota bacterium]|nr:NAD(P)/FAD-dependent oxidoreductase [Planctomycetota bacterium]
MIASSESTDVIVIGGGPSGSATATLLAQRGYRVTVFEREHFPRFHIGESMIPYCYPMVKRLGMLDKMKGSHFTKKYGVQFINELGKLSEPFRFGQYDTHERSQSWQVVRSEFDKMLLDNARDQGVVVHEGARVLDVLFDGDRAYGVKVKLEGETEKEVRAQVIVDASGQSSIIMDRMNLREWDPVLKKAAIWTYWKGAYRDPGIDGGGTVVIQTEGKKGWFWYIPLHDDVVSVGVVAGHDYLFKDRASKDPETIYWEEVSRCPGLQPRIKDAVRTEDYRMQKEYSYKAKKAAGDGWVLVGDAFGFLDPLYSSGLMLALTSAGMAADSVADALDANDPSEARLRSWEIAHVKAMERMRYLVCAFYDGLNFGKLVRKFPDKKHLITDVLIGNLFNDEVDQLKDMIAELVAEEQMAASV